VGATPTPATIFKFETRNSKSEAIPKFEARKIHPNAGFEFVSNFEFPHGRRSGCRSVKPVSKNITSEVTTGALPAPPTISGLVAQSVPTRRDCLREG
jgi:hypothetical protein